MSEVLYNFAIIDAASEPEYFELFAQQDPLRSCLYEEPLDSDISKVAPYLIELTDDVKDWLDERTTPWGIYLSSEFPLIPLRQHLRQSLQAQVPDDEKPQLFRYYDPRIIWLYIDAVPDLERYHFLGPMNAIATHYGTERSENFDSLKATFAKLPVDRHGPLKLSQPVYQAIIDGCIQQMEQAVYVRLNQTIEQNELDKPDESSNAVYTLRLNEDEPTDLVSSTRPTAEQLSEFAKQLVRQLSYLGITQQRLITGIAQLCAHHHYYRWEQLPTDWMDRLCDENHRPLLNAQMLMIDHLGYVPA
ncbi:DUF4123 domain-containing protein [Celerinatantimonas diazotrophica]|uniref:Uncharacterized protein DUF4123 n=2 Tax=Celerinatantimonas diazotrophica TaxID=412034 RepID=A0A4R1K2A6_9GAMM|nr:DUF4123 domain-containing protein [Celerinatantimonas diazotrophica]TCK58156.1 uncharacterized protein DUF4123 [Celerinatantimonas diazotrophica]CAG9297772.1 hypothetical protein CEDIAZO_02963 [Celerinatantimonas diazotrophica]